MHALADNRAPNLCNGLEQTCPQAELRLLFQFVILLGNTLSDCCLGQKLQQYDVQNLDGIKKISQMHNRPPAQLDRLSS